MGIHRDSPSIHEGKTWLEPEEWTYPAGGFTRRALVRCPDGRYRVVQCSISDTYWTIPARLVYRRRHISGFITLDEKSTPKEFVFQPTGKNRDVFGPTEPVAPSDCPEKVQAVSEHIVPNDPPEACRLPDPKQFDPGVEYLDENNRTWRRVDETWVRVK